MNVLAWLRDHVGLQIVSVAIATLLWVVVSGEVTVEREVRAPLKLVPPSTLAGSLVIKRADFGIGEGLWAKFDVVANEITVNLKLKLK